LAGKPPPPEGKTEISGFQAEKVWEGGNQVGTPRYLR